MQIYLDDIVYNIMASACSIRVRGVVQGVGFRPFVYRLACANTLNGWVLNAEEGVEIHLEGAETGLEAFVRDLKAQPPPAASIAEIDVRPAEPVGLQEFTIRTSQRRERPTVRISPDLPVCDDCLRELFDPADPRYLYPYINCTNCGPRYTVVLALPYDRPNTTMKDWLLDDYCAAEYSDPGNRRFHAQPVACPACGPATIFTRSLLSICTSETAAGAGGSIRAAAEILRAGAILAVKGLGGYHLACDARNPAAVTALRDRKYPERKTLRPDGAGCRDGAHPGRAFLGGGSSCSLPSRVPSCWRRQESNSRGSRPENNELGVMLPYTPLHHLLFAAGAPEILVMTSANRSSEPIAYEDEDALQRLTGIADSFLIGQRPIARRVDDSVARAGAFGPVVLRRARGYAPGAVASIPAERPILALGADLKNTITLVVNGQAFVSQHIGDLDDYQSFRAFDETIHDLVSMYEVRWDELLLVHDLHPQYLSTAHAASLGVPRKRGGAAPPRPRGIGSCGTGRVDETSRGRKLRRHRIRRRRNYLGRRDLRRQRAGRFHACRSFAPRRRSRAGTQRRAIRSKRLPGSSPR